VVHGPDPRGPYYKPGARAPFVKELVRINHHLNCLLCHPPSFTSADKARGLVPGLDEPLSPPASREYYAPERQGTFVRADITYLKQDFSAMLPVADHGPWPAMQRFDFFVRERAATEDDLQENLIRRKAGPSEQHEWAMFALRELTGLDPGPALADWNLVLGRTLDVRLRHRGFTAARALAVDGKGRAYVVDGNRVVRLEGGAKAEMRHGAEGPAAWAGLALDREGRLLAGRRDPAGLARIDPDTGGVTPLAWAVAGKPLVGPRCLAVDGAGGVYFGDHPGSELRGGGVLYRSAGGAVSRTTALPGRVDGLGLAPDGKTLYVAQGAELRAYAVTSPGSLGRSWPMGRLASRGGQGGAAGLAVDARGLVYVVNGPARQVEVFGPEAAAVAYACLDEAPVACAAGGGKVYVLTRTALHAVSLPTGPTAVAAR
jgi:sugar lactone lactonase YvrE